MAARASPRLASDRRRASTAADVAAAAAGGARYGAMIFIIGATILHASQYVGGVVFDHAPALLGAEVEMNGTFDYSRMQPAASAVAAPADADSGASRLEFLAPEARNALTGRADPTIPRMFASASDENELTTPRIRAVDVR